MATCAIAHAGKELQILEMLFTPLDQLLQKLLQLDFDSWAFPISLIIIICSWSHDWNLLTYVDIGLRIHTGQETRNSLHKATHDID